MKVTIVKNGKVRLIMTPEDDFDKAALQEFANEDIGVEKPSDKLVVVNVPMPESLIFTSKIKVIVMENNIQYQYTEGKSDVPIPVRLNGKRVGTIKPVEGGWQYFPIHHKKGGDIFTTVQEVQKSLELEEEN